MITIKKPAIYFVGQNGKPGYYALNPKTITGKMVNRLMAQLPADYYCHRTNLSSRAYLPMHPMDVEFDRMEWHNFYQPTDRDIIVLFGKWVQKYFYRNSLRRFVEMPHPKSLFGAEQTLDYLAEFQQKFKSVIQQ